jgi:hypothetical protein
LPEGTVWRKEAAGPQSILPWYSIQGSLCLSGHLALQAHRGHTML